MKQYKLGQHYSSNEKLMIPYKETLKEKREYIIVDPFVGEGHLIFFYLNLFSKEEQINIIKNKMIRGYDIDSSNIAHLKIRIKENYEIEDSLLDEIFIVRDSLLDNSLPENSYILTNPPYLAKNVCKQKFPEDFKYFEIFKEYNDYFEIAINQYFNYDGIWIVPANIISSENMKKTRKLLLNKMHNIFIYEEKVFDDTNISVISYEKGDFTSKININFNSVSYEYTPNNGELIDEWQNILTYNDKSIKHGYITISNGDNQILMIDENYKEKTICVNDDDYLKLTNNFLILRTVDTGSSNGEIGLYTIKELWNSEAEGLITKISSRVYTQLFLNLNYEEQIKLKKLFNLKLKELRNKYNSIFLTNFKNSINGKQRKRIGFTEAFSLISYIIAEEFYQN